MALLAKIRAMVSQPEPTPKFSIARLRQLTQYLSANVSRPIVDINVDSVCAKLREVAEILVWGDQNDQSTIFDFFLENRLFSLFTSLLVSQPTVDLNSSTSALDYDLKTGTPLRASNATCSPAAKLNAAVVATTAMIMSNITHTACIYYILSAGQIDVVLRHSFDFVDTEVLSNYISLLKSLSLRLDVATVQFFFTPDRQDAFLLFTNAIRFLRHVDPMVRTAVRSIVLNVVKVQDRPTVKYVVSETSFLSDVVHVLNTLCLRLSFGAEDVVGSGAVSPPTAIAFGAFMEEISDTLLYFNDLAGIGNAHFNSALNATLQQLHIGPLLIDSLVLPLANRRSGTSSPRSPRDTVTMEVMRISRPRVPLAALKDGGPLAMHVALYLLAQISCLLTALPDVATSLAGALSDAPGPSAYADAVARSKALVERRLGTKVADAVRESPSPRAPSLFHAEEEAPQNTNPFVGIESPEPEPVLPVRHSRPRVQTSSASSIPAAVASQHSKTPRPTVARLDLSASKAQSPSVELLDSAGVPESVSQAASLQGIGGNLIIHSLQSSDSRVRIGALLVMMSLMLNTTIPSELLDACGLRTLKAVRTRARLNLILGEDETGSGMILPSSARTSSVVPRQHRRSRRNEALFDSDSDDANSSPKETEKAVPSLQPSGAELTKSPTSPKSRSPVSDNGESIIAAHTLHTINLSAQTLLWEVRGFGPTSCASRDCAQTSCAVVPCTVCTVADRCMETRNVSAMLAASIRPYSVFLGIRVLVNCFLLPGAWNTSPTDLPFGLPDVAKNHLSEAVAIASARQQWWTKNVFSPSSVFRGRVGYLADFGDSGRVVALALFTASVFKEVSRSFRQNPERFVGDVTHVLQFCDDCPLVMKNIPSVEVGVPSDDAVVGSPRSLVPGIPDEFFIERASSSAAVAELLRSSSPSPRRHINVGSDEAGSFCAGFSLHSRHPHDSHELGECLMAVSLGLQCHMMWPLMHSNTEVHPLHSLILPRRLHYVGETLSCVRKGHFLSPTPRLASSVLSGSFRAIVTKSTSSARVSLAVSSEPSMLRASSVHAVGNDTVSLPSLSLTSDVLEPTEVTAQTEPPSAGKDRPLLQVGFPAVVFVDVAGNLVVAEIVVEECEQVKAASAQSPMVDSIGEQDMEQMESCEQTVPADEVAVDPLLGIVVASPPKGVTPTQQGEASPRQAFPIVKEEDSTAVFCTDTFLVVKFVAFPLFSTVSPDPALRAISIVQHSEMGNAVPTTLFASTSAEYEELLNLCENSVRCAHDGFSGVLGSL